MLTEQNETQQAGAICTPISFYKYMTSSTAKVVLENQTLRWTTPSTLNDPYDIQFNLAIDFDRAKVLELALEKSWEVYSGEYQVVAGSQIASTIGILRSSCPNMDKEFFYNHLSKGFLEAFEHIESRIADVWKSSRMSLSTSKILCLTDSPLNQLMWAYYADGNKGAVLQFRNSDEGSPYSEAKPVRYKKSIPSLFSEDELSDFLSGRITFSARKRIDDLVYTKSEAWAHESEWRIFAGDGRNKQAPHEDVTFAQNELTAVILGCRMPETERCALAELTRRLYPDAEIFQTCTIDHKYELKLKKYAY